MSQPTLTTAQEALVSSVRSDMRAPPRSVTEGIGLLQPEPGMRILDLGCGPGAHLGLLAELVGEHGHVTGLDVDGDGVTVARRLWDVEIAGNRMSVLQADVMALPFDDRDFDAVWASMVFHHLPEPGAALRELTRVIRPGGRIALLDGDLGCSFPSLPWPPELEDRVRAASWRAARERYGDALPYHYDPFFSRHMLGLLHQTGGFVQCSIHAIPEVVHAPVAEDEAKRLGEWFSDWLDGRLRPYLTPRDHANLHALLDPDRPGNLLVQPGFYLSRTWFLAIGQRPGIAER